MGKSYAERSVAEGAAQVVLLDVNEDALAEMVAEPSAAGGTVASYLVDLSSRTEIAKVAARILKDVGTPQVLINNAGIVRSSNVWEHDPAGDIEPTMQINTLAPMYLTRGFLPAMIRMRARAGS